MLFKLEGYEEIGYAPSLKIGNYIQAWYRENMPGYLISRFHSNAFLVTLRCVKHGDNWQSSRIITELLHYEAENNAWTWDNFWWRAEDEIEVLGFIDIDHITVDGAPDNFKCVGREIGYVRSDAWWEGETAQNGEEKENDAG